ncbi:MAG: oligosaccharide flippase family protein [Thermoanaerobaculia bacterium]
MSTKAARAIARDIFLNIAGQALPLLVAAATIPATIEGLGNERFGLLTLAWGVLAAFAVLDSAIGRGVTRLVAQSVDDEHRAASVLRGAIELQCGVGLTAGALVLVLAPFTGRVLGLEGPLRAESSWMLAILSAAIPMTFIAGCYRAFLEGKKRFAVVNVIRFIGGSSTFVIPWVGAHRGWSIGEIVGAIVAARFGILAASAAACGFKAGRAARITVKRDLIEFGGWISLANVVLPLLSVADRVLVTRLTSLAALPAFAVPQELVTRLSIVSVSVVAAYFPRMAAAQSMEEQTRLIRRAFVASWALVAVPAFLLLAGARPLLRWWASPEFAAAAAIPLRWMAVALLISAATPVVVAVLQVRRIIVPMSVVRWIELPCFLAMQFILIRQYGVAGAAAGIVVRSVVDLIALGLVSAPVSFSSALSSSSRAVHE